MQTEVAVELRLATEQDEPFLNRLFCDTHEAEFAPLQLPEAQLSGLMQMQVHAQREGYRRLYPKAVDRLVMQDGQPVGRMLVDEETGAFHLVDIALFASAQGAGLGTFLMEELLARAHQRQCRVRLHVKPGNRAFHLYSRLGFKVVGGGANLQMEYVPKGMPDGPADEAQRVCKPDAPSSLLADWLSRENWSFDVQNASLKLRLSEVARSRVTGQGGFSLIFEGPLEPVMPQGMCTLVHHAGLEVVEDIFIVPIGPKAGVMRYEAVFNP